MKHLVCSCVGCVLQNIGQPSTHPYIHTGILSYIRTQTSHNGKVSGTAQDRKALQRVIKLTRSSLAPSTEHQWHWQSEMSVQSPEDAKRQHPAQPHFDRSSFLCHFSSDCGIQHQASHIRTGLSPPVFSLETSSLSLWLSCQIAHPWSSWLHASPTSWRIGSKA